MVRVLGLADTADAASARTAASKLLKRLEDRKLIARGRRNRKAVVTLLREDGSGAAYERPEGHTRSDRWLQLPHSYWTGRFHETLSLPAKIVLLIALTLPDNFPMRKEMALDWYGVSPDLMGDGLAELGNAGLLVRTRDWVKAPRSDIGWTQVDQYTLVGPFSDDARKAASKSRFAAPTPVQSDDLTAADPTAPSSSRPSPPRT